MDANTLTAATALFHAVAVVFGAAAVLLSAPVVATLLRRATHARQSDSRIHAGEDS
ncbi:MAG: hypothetical protein J0H34_23845 [Rhizobiales bacterium]|jgi:hypothetical protein|nr:hypothetical protein [Hyphomicrobiales bacterium]